MRKVAANILAAARPGRIERGLVAVSGEITPVRIHMLNHRRGRDREDFHTRRPG